MQDRSMGKAPSIPEARPTDEEILIVKGMIGSFLIALRNYALYPEDHAMSRKSLAAVEDRLDGFLAGHECLRLNVEKDRFLFQGEIVHQGPPQEESLAFQLFREGIQWLEFRNGFTAEELNVFFKLLNRYRIAKEEAEGELVTALWEADFPHLQYKNEDVLWEAEPLIDFSLLKVTPGEVRPAEEAAEEPLAPAAKIAMPAADDTFWKLTPAEEKEIQAMILEEETRDCKDPTNVLFELTRHAQDSVCKDAINALVDRDPQNLRKFFPLIEDPLLSIRSMICGHLTNGGRRI